MMQSTRCAAQHGDIPFVQLHNSINSQQQKEKQENVQENKKNVLGRRQKNESDMVLQVLGVGKAAATRTSAFQYIYCVSLCDGRL